MLPHDLQLIVEAAKKADNSAYDLIERISIDKFSAHQIVSTAIAAKENAFELGGLEVAERLLIQGIELHPDNHVLEYELGVVYRHKYDLPKALHHARKAYILTPEDDRLQLYYLHMLYANRQFIMAEKFYLEIRKNFKGVPLDLEAMHDFGEYIKRFPIEAAREINADIRRNHYWGDTNFVASQIAEAIRSKRPFALIRLGDGEGAFVRIDEKDEAAHKNLYEHFRKYWIKFLLGDNVDPIFNGYSDLTSKLMDFTLEADIVGIPYSDWIEHEYKICANRTIPCLLNINRYIASYDKVKFVTLCDQDVHLQLHRANAYQTILRDVESATVISCIEGVDGKISSMFSIPNVDLIKIPSENYAPHLDRINSQRDTKHFPLVFWRTIEQLSCPLHGRVFLIAAGTYGKFYAAIIKRNGGIALDLGSIVDGWMKLSSRPFYDKEFDIE